MKQAVIIACMLISGLLLTVVCSTNSAGTSDLKELTTDEQKFSYSIGMDIGASLQGIKDDVDLSVVLQAIKDTLEGRKVLLTADEASEIKRITFNAKQQKLSGENQKEQNEFLAKNKDAEGVVTTESGLQYQVMRKGTGPKPAATDKVQVHYRGTLLDGKEFDSSYKRSQPAVFQVNGVIPGWSEALQLMKEGAMYKLWVPSKLGYGERGAGAKIGPNTMLIFEVELLKIMK